MFAPTSMMVIPGRSTDARNAVSVRSSTLLPTGTGRNQGTRDVHDCPSASAPALSAGRAQGAVQKDAQAHLLPDRRLLGLAEAPP